MNPMSETILYFKGGSLDGYAMKYQPTFKPSRLHPFPPVSYQFIFHKTYWLFGVRDGGFVYTPKKPVRRSKKLIRAIEKILAE